MKSKWLIDVVTVFAFLHSCLSPYLLWALENVSDKSQVKLASEPLKNVLRWESFRGVGADSIGQAPHQFRKLAATK